MYKKYKKLFAVSITCFFTCVYTAYTFDREAQEHTATQDTAWSSVVHKTYTTLAQKSYKQFSLDQVLPKALDALCQVDGYSRFLGPCDYQDLVSTTQGEFYGIGVILGSKTLQENCALILDCIPTSPAQKSGLQRYDKIIAIDGQPLRNCSVDEVARKLKSLKRYSPVTLTLLRGTKRTFTVTLKRDTIKHEAITSYYFPTYQIGYCKLSLFTAHTADQLRQALMQILAKKPRGLLLDLRDNAGGLIQAAVDCAALFLPKHTPVVTTKDRYQKTIEQHSTQTDQLIGSPVLCCILVNEYTASAGEIFAGALQLYAQKSTGHSCAYNPCIVIIGTQTHGKGSVQEILPVGNNCALKLTTSLCYLPDNLCIDGIGITPDISSKQKSGTNRRKKQSKQLDHQATLLRTIQNDHQIQTAVNILNLLDLARSRKKHYFKTHDQVLAIIRNYFVTHASTLKAHIITLQ